MKITKSVLIHCFLLLLSMAKPLAAQEIIVLNGTNISYQDLLDVANGKDFRIDEVARKRVQSSYNLMLKSAENGAKIYGFTSGVGLNKDQKALEIYGSLSQEVFKRSIEFNKSIIRAHACSVGDPLPPFQVRLIMAVRLNMLLTGFDGVKQEVPDLLALFLKNDIIPYIPSKGSVGEADITILSHIALAMIGEGNVYYHGALRPAKSVLDTLGLSPLEPVAKDALGVFSSNAYSLAMAVQFLEQIKRIQNLRKPLYVATLEALNGNVSPFSETAIEMKGFKPARKVGGELNQLLKGSYLTMAHPHRKLQDPLSFRNEIWHLAKMQEAIERAEIRLNEQLSHSDHNPGIALHMYTQIKKNAVVPNSNFDPITWFPEFEAMALLLSSTSHNAAQRIIKLNDPKITGLSRYLKVGDMQHGFGAVEKTLAYLANENQQLLNPTIPNTFSVAGGIEDVASHAPLQLRNMLKAIDNQYYLMAIESLHAVQALDIRTSQEHIPLSETTKVMVQQIRNLIPAMDKDRILSTRFEKIYYFLKNE